MINIRNCILILLVQILPFSLFALKPGDKATDLEVLKWLKGNPVTIDAAKGRNILVIEFWATWAPLCKESMPLLSDIQKKYADKDVTVIGITTEEEKIVGEFINTRNYIDYRIALDDSKKTFKRYMEGDSGIPALFVIGKDGTVLWKGHPMELESVLEKIISDKFDIELQRKISIMHDELQKAMEKNSIGAVVNISNGILELDPSDDFAVRCRLYVFESANQPKEALEFLNKLQFKAPKHFPLYFMELGIMDKIGSAPDEKRKIYEKVFFVFKDDFEVLSRLSWMISDQMAFGTGSVKLELETAKRALDLLPQESEGRKKAMCLNALARAYYNAGHIEKAVLIQKEAVRNFVGYDEEKHAMILLKYYQEAHEAGKEASAQKTK